MGEKGAFLGNIADAPPFGRNVRFCSGDNGAPNADAALVQPLEAADASQQRRLAAAGSTQNRQQSAQLDCQVEAAQHRASAERLGQPADCELGHSGKPGLAAPNTAEAPKR